ncbi:hypothetical protein FGO68_gene14416 [Halteria grandinella]|uniref:Uncharacterized protein n=1 Tax=Halteria grandinella TaxID=5974 RepID=A0A8J8T716_HALGN|nr:hypothetical protein FGO68_gene14416 [Halteria grandinella]
MRFLNLKWPYLLLESNDKPFQGEQVPIIRSFHKFAPLSPLRRIHIFIKGIIPIDVKFNGTALRECALILIPEPDKKALSRIKLSSDFSKQL